MRIDGYMQGPRAVIRLRVRGLTTQWHWMTCEIDTGVDPMFMTSATWFDHLGVETQPCEAIVLVGRSLLRDCRLTIDYGLRTVLIEPSKGMPA